MQPKSEAFVKCHGTGCPIKKLCYRYNAKGDPVVQTFFSVIPFNFEEGKCNKYVTDDHR